MRFSAGIIIATAGFAAAASTTTTAAASAATCAAQNIVDACLESTKTQLDNCTPNDWQCMCDAQINVVTCYNNCPGQQEGVIAQQQEESWCQAAKQANPSSTTKVASTVATSTATTTATSSSASDATFGGTSTASASASATHNAAAGLMAPTGGFLAIALGFFGLF